MSKSILCNKCSNIGGYLNAATGYEETEYMVKVLSEHIEIGIDATVSRAAVRFNGAMAHFRLGRFPAVLWLGGALPREEVPETR